MIARFIACTVVCGLGTASANLINAGFETGDFTGWDVFGLTTIEDASFGVAPTEGSQFALIETGERALDASFFNFSPSMTGADAAALEAGAGLPSGSLSLVPDLNNLGSSVTEGSLLTQQVQVQPGFVFSFDFNLLTDELPGDITDDGVFFSLSNGITSELILIDRVSSASLSGFTSSLYFDETDWMSFSYTFADAGLYTLGIGVFDFSDEFVSTALAVDNAELIVPEPAVLFVIGPVALFALSFARRRLATAAK